MLITRSLVPRSAENSSSPRKPGPPQVPRALIEAGLYPIARPPERPDESKAEKSQPGAMEDRAVVTESAGPRVSWSRMMSIGREIINLLRAIFLEALAKPLQLKDKHFMGGDCQGYA